MTAEDWIVLAAVGPLIFLGWVFVIYLTIFSAIELWNKFRG